MLEHGFIKGNGNIPSEFFLKQVFVPLDVGDDLNALDQSDVEVVRRCMLKFGAYHCVDFLQLTRDLSENRFLSLLH